MASIKSYYWHDRVYNGRFLNVFRSLGFDTSKYFKTGNAGDIFSKDLIEYIYPGQKVINTQTIPKRLLCVGSISHQVANYDIICGIGSKEKEFSKNLAPETCLVYGLRGPLSLQQFKKASFDLSHLKFLYDPGLMIRYMYDLSNIPVVKNKIGFIPHYRERYKYLKTLPKNIQLIDIDDTPKKLAENILSCEHIYSSSLHGIIFSHSLNRPCTFVLPQTQESLFKFEDYYLSINQKMPQALESIEAANFTKDSHSPISLNIQRNDFQFPSIEILRERGVAL